MSSFVLFDDVPQHRAILLCQYHHSDIVLPHQLSQLDNYLQQGWAQQLHCAIFADYELGLPLQQLSHLNHHTGSLKIHWFQEKHLINHAEAWLAQHSGNEPAGIATPTINQTKDDYQQTIAAIHAAIQRGETYQINHTLRLTTTTYGNPIRLYTRLRQNVPYAALAALPDNNWTLCFSPELFLRIQADGTISTEPMKGTAPILNDGNDEQRAQQLKQDPKNLAENTMIVDLLRNDLGKLAEIGSVCVPEPFKVQAFGKVWQMTSLVQAKLKQGIGIANIIQATFPCGSITGAPKRKSMEIINHHETTPRGLYTGSIGFLEPAPDTPLGFSGCLNVVIRTLTLSPTENSQQYQGNYGVGSGIVIDSQAEDEYNECRWKARFLSELRPEFDLFETMRVEQQSIPLLSQHLNRMAQSAHQLNIPFNPNTAKQYLQTILNTLNSQLTYRLKLILTRTGELKSDYAILPPFTSPQKVIIAPQTLPNHDPLRRHKTTHRHLFDQAWQQAEQHGAFDSLLFNQDGYLLEGGRSSIMILFNQQWLTTSPTLDILPSITQTLALESGIAQPAYITQAMLQQAQSIRLGNALRGWFDVEWITP